MKVAKAEEMRLMDRMTIEETGIAGIVLMENASQAVARAAKKAKSAGRCCVVCGGGNNGGDGFAVARLMANAGYLVEVVFLGEEGKLPADAAANAQVAKKMGFSFLRTEEEAMAAIGRADLVVDALFGTGFHGVPRQREAKLIAAINASEAYVVAVDIPSGVNADNGQVEGEAVRADKTVTFHLPKVGLLLYPGAEYAGEVEIADISIPKGQEERLHLAGNVLTKEEAGKLLPKRPKRSNKGTFGRVVLVAGSEEMTGAGVFAALGAYGAGCGLVTAAMVKGCGQVMHQLVPEAVFLPVEEEKGQISVAGAKALRTKMERGEVVIVGPGLGTGEQVKEAVQTVLAAATGPVVLDADGLNVLSEEMEVLKKRQGVTILTPHPKEMSRLCKKTVKEILADTIGTATAFAAEYGVIVVLKDARTIIAFPDGQYFINCSGCAAMAKGGSGDVLSGILGGLLAQGLSAKEAAVLGVFLHGLAGEEAEKEKGSYSVLARDLAAYLGKAISSIQA